MEGQIVLSTLSARMRRPLLHQKGECRRWNEDGRQRWQLVDGLVQSECSLGGQGSGQLGR